MPTPNKGKFLRYGAWWEPGTDDLEVEGYCIRKGGKWKNAQGKECGLGLFEHYMNFRKLAWPDRYRHRWTDLVYRNYIENEVTILIGPASSQKTSGLVECVLIDWWCHPDNTLVLLSTTKVEKLEMAIFGETKMLWEQGRNRYPWLPGHLLNNAHAITYDSLKEDGVRDMRKGIVGRALYQGTQYVGLGHWAGIKQDRIRFLGDELQFCFPRGAMVDTLCGKSEIQNLKVGDFVLSACGYQRVKKLSSHKSKELVRMSTKDGRIFHCTPEHPFFTQKGWIKACNLGEEHYIMSPHETMLLLQTGIFPETSQDSFLQFELRSEMDAHSTRYSSEDLYAGKVSEGVSIEKEMVGLGSGTAHEGKSFSKYDRQQSDAQCRVLSKSGCFYTGVWCSASHSRGERNGANKSGVATFENVSRGIEQLPHKNRNEIGKRVPSLLQSGLGTSFSEAGNRSGRWFSQQSNSTRSGREKNLILKGSWVDSVAILEQADIRREFPDSDNEGCRVYNISVEGHPSYSVNGLVSHNCPMALADVLPNMMGSTTLTPEGRPDFKFGGSGNPKHDPYDCLSQIGEPLSGWASMGGITKTTVWPLKGFERGKGVNLIGSDSPNFDVPEGAPAPYPKLLSRQFVKMVEKRWGRGSMKWYSQCEGKMMMNMVGNRVITKELCEQHGAFTDVIWKNDQQTRVGFLDPAWAGKNADRCVFGWLDFGEDREGRQIVSFGKYMVVPFASNSKIEPDDQIAQFVEEQARMNDIEPENIFYDSSGKGTTGAALARVFGFKAPKAVYFGGNPTTRPVRHDLYVNEPNGVKRLKRCDEEYRKFVSELWFASRNVIECGQMRNLPEEVAHEGCLREYMEAPGGKIEVEKKEDTRERMGMSPDLYDAFVVGIEGARQLGFKIERLGEAVIVEKGEDDWFEKDAEEFQDVLKSKLLSHA